MTEPITCTHCNTELTEDEAYTVAEETLCQDCYDDETFTCIRCGERFWNDSNAGDNDTPLCANCYDYHYTSCERCGRILHNDDANYFEDDEDNDVPYCYSCYASSEKDHFLHEYSYKPDPIFFGEGNRFFGVELEIDEGGKDNANAKEITVLANQQESHIYIKTDGSLNEGMEIVTHPMSLDYHMSKMPWEVVLEKAVELGYRSHKTSTCGLHIHVSKNCFAVDSKVQDECIGRVLFFVERFWEEMLRFSRRTEHQVNQWAARYGYKNRPKEILDHAKKSGASRYTCVNLTNYSTIEFRIFRGTLKLNTIIAALQMVNEICNAAISMSDEELAALSWCEFMERLDKSLYPQLITYLKERRLYINEPIICEEDA